MKRDRFIATAASLLALGSLPSPAEEVMPAGASASSNDARAIVIARSGAQASRQGGEQNFTGKVCIAALFQAQQPSRVSSASVSFEPGARTVWHTHPLGQTLIVTAGTGRVQRWGDAVQDSSPGMWCGSRRVRSTGMVRLLLPQ